MLVVAWQAIEFVRRRTFSLVLWAPSLTLKAATLVWMVFSGFSEDLLFLQPPTPAQGAAGREQPSDFLWAG